MTVRRWRAKPVEVEAWQWLGDNYADLPDGWLRSDHFYLDRRGNLVVRTPHGAAKPAKDDYVVKGTAGEFYPVPRAVFEYKYEPVQ